MNKEYLWVNIIDLADCGTLGLVGGFLNLMVCSELGDRRLAGGVMSVRGNLDAVFVVIETTPERVEALVPAIQLVGQRKIGRDIRTRVTKRPPGKGWKWIAG